jgi:pimeloyl-ACP methyl ester carboxylesterase
VNAVAFIAGGLTVAATGYLVLRYRRDLAQARVRLSSVQRRTAFTESGAVEYCEWGEGIPLLLVHGVVGGCDVPPSWRALVPAEYKVITPSRFGYLGSPMPQEPTVAAQVETFVALLDSLEIERLPVLAFSAGTTSAVLMALRYPERVSALILVASNSPHAKPVTLTPRVFAPLIFSQPTLWFLRAFLPSTLASIAGKPKDYELDEEDNQTLETIFDSFFPMAERSGGSIFDGYVGNLEIAGFGVEEVSVPTLGVHAADDPLASYEDARAMVTRIPNSRWVRVERGGHIFIHKDAEALRQIATFLADTSQTQSAEHQRREPTLA